jgi:hypothetical protein
MEFLQSDLNLAIGKDTPVEIIYYRSAASMERMHASAIKHLDLKELLANVGMVVANMASVESPNSNLVNVSMTSHQVRCSQLREARPQLHMSHDLLNMLSRLLKVLSCLLEITGTGLLTTVRFLISRVTLHHG